jgi:hypothetical protein
MAPARLDRLARADHQAALRAAQQLVGAEATTAAPARTDRRTAGSSASSSTSSASTPEPTSSMTGTPSSHSASISTSSVKPSVRKFDGWRAQDGARALAQSRRVVARRVRFVVPDLDQARRPPARRPRGCEAAADLDELPARDDDVAPRARPAPRPASRTRPAQLLTPRPPRRP